MSNQLFSNRTGKFVPRHLKLLLKTLLGDVIKDDITLKNPFDSIERDTTGGLLTVADLGVSTGVSITAHEDLILKISFTSGIVVTNETSFTRGDFVAKISLNGESPGFSRICFSIEASSPGSLYCLSATDIIEVNKNDVITLSTFRSFASVLVQYQAFNNHLVIEILNR